jgi:hypothetical protein
MAVKYPAVTRYLLSSGAEVTVLKHSGYTELMMAAT